ncbi:hypothetical protein AOZ06_04665 [Kibdelosporangium phytohabitans]|uniref:Uncharacterized protein n=1 Tax=Kibdelosporangium phytohabitans TaxID=860235 RepID=A0A0N9HWR9_9PSEU|nr:hypothetical protein AOZ06_04665 [Kibdelosporangium phytohabitans]
MLLLVHPSGQGGHRWQQQLSSGGGDIVSNGVDVRSIGLTEQLMGQRDIPGCDAGSLEKPCRACEDSGDRAGSTGALICVGGENVSQYGNREVN